MAHVGTKIVELLDKMDLLEAQDAGGRKAVEAEFNELCRKNEEITANKLKLVHQKLAKFTPQELCFAATSRCSCGAGFAYPEDTGIHGQWECSAILMGEAEAGSTHSSPLPFAFYEVKSESQPSANGATTRPKGTHVETEPHLTCRKCATNWIAPRYRSTYEASREAMKAIQCPNCGERYLNENGSSNSNIQSRWFDVVVDDAA